VNTLGLAEFSAGPKLLAQAGQGWFRSTGCCRILRGKLFQQIKLLPQLRRLLRARPGQIDLGGSRCHPSLVGSPRLLSFHSGRGGMDQCRLVGSAFTAA
jgi:hypothetical protein